VFTPSYFFNVVITFLFANQPEGAAQHIDFSSNMEIYGYVPMLKFGSHPFPYLCCDVDEIDQDLIGWNDASHSYDHYNLIFEVPHQSLRRTETIDHNTRAVSRIVDADGYKEALESSKQKASARAQSSRKSPLYSVVKHYPTKWQKAFLKKGEDWDA
jgi:hypothetical protein